MKYVNNAYLTLLFLSYRMGNTHTGLHKLKTLSGYIFESFLTQDQGISEGVFCFLNTPRTLIIE